MPLDLLLKSVKKIVGQIPSPLLINVIVCQNMCSFLFFLLTCFCNFDLAGGGGGFKVFAFDIVKVFFRCALPGFFPYAMLFFQSLINADIF